ncbi:MULTISPECIES: hypothetical protein [Bradyrhizobium]|uniref:hypothetical protein n=1 Tax=Bradyrhizobium TaxID=374 RepID=UPI0012D75A59|nr:MULTISPECIES: hypothetical protein [Bradyrhizobium]QIO98693.1 hypothetical protein HAU86_02170 [Bradyrhizobium symbiodeficiens]UPJ60171.1 hypothetical protein IVB24_11295 [Bradyrhizobium sp. 192]
MEDLEDYIHRENLKIFKREIGLERDAVRRRWLLKRLAEEEAKGRAATWQAAAGSTSPGAPKGECLVSDTYSIPEETVPAS